MTQKNNLFDNQKLPTMWFPMTKLTAPIVELYFPRAIFAFTLTVTIIILYSVTAVVRTVRHIYCIISALCVLASTTAHDDLLDESTETFREQTKNQIEIHPLVRQWRVR